MTYIGVLKAPVITMSRAARAKRFEKLKSSPCIACKKEGRINTQVDIHHLNLGGHAGQERRGDAYTIPLCLWHHRGIPAQVGNSKMARELLGPSLAKQSKAFRERYGTDDDLLAEVNSLIGASL